MKEKFGKTLKEYGLPVGLLAVGGALLYHKEYFLGAILAGLGVFAWTRRKKESAAIRNSQMQSVGSNRVKESSSGRMALAEAA